MEFAVSDYLKDVQVKGKFLYRPFRLKNVEAPRISIQFAHEGGMVLSSTHRPSLRPREDAWFSFLIEAESTPKP